MSARAGPITPSPRPPLHFAPASHLRRATPPPLLQSTASCRPLPVAPAAEPTRPGWCCRPHIQACMGWLARARCAAGPPPAAVTASCVWVVRFVLMVALPHSCLLQDRAMQAVQVTTWIVAARARVWSGLCVGSAGTLHAPATVASHPSHVLTGARVRLFDVHDHVASTQHPHSTPPPPFWPAKHPFGHTHPAVTNGTACSCGSATAAPRALNPRARVRGAACVRACVTHTKRHTQAGAHPAHSSTQPQHAHARSTLPRHGSAPHPQAAAAARGVKGRAAEGR
jgi:hypothetical protein